MKVKFEKGRQKEFLDLVKQKLLAPSIRSLLQFGISTNYSQLKNFYSERRLISKNLFNELCQVSGLDKKGFSVKFLEDNWGQVKGGKKSRR